MVRELELSDIEMKKGSGTPEGLTITVVEVFRTHTWDMLVPGCILDTPDVLGLRHSQIMFTGFFPDSLPIGHSALATQKCLLNLRK